MRAAAANSNKGSPIGTWPRITSGFTSNCSAGHQLKRQLRVAARELGQPGKNQCTSAISPYWLQQFQNLPPRCACEQRHRIFGCLRHFDFGWGGSAAQKSSSRKRKSISRTVSDLTGKIQSAGVERQPGVEHLRCKARRPLVPPTTSIWRPEITVLQPVQ